MNKNWIVRAHAYDELNQMCQEAEVNSSSCMFHDHVYKWTTYLKDVNPGALEKALACLENFLKKVPAKLLLDH